MTLGVVQFPHPGPEPQGVGPVGTVLPWNTGTHKRKFLVGQGAWMASPDGVLQQGAVAFWGEWEAESRVARVWPANGDLPCTAFEPFWQPKASYAALQNTDPFVFGDQFIYGNCRQYRGLTSPTGMRHLEPGTMILFGSSLDPRGDRARFVLDTVLVVADVHGYDIRDAAALAGLVPPAYDELTRRPIAEDPDIVATPAAFADLRLYRGATPARREHAMFSFVPCLPDAEGRARFERPRIDLRDLVTPSNARNWRLSELALPEIRSAWDAVVTQVLGAGLALGVHVDLPSRDP